MVDLHSLIVAGEAPENTIGITVVDETSFQQLPERDRAWAQSVGFSLKSVGLCPMPGADGSFSHYLASLGRDIESEPWATAAICDNLPAGDYRLTGYGEDALKAGAIGWLLAHYSFDAYKGEPEPQKKRRLVAPAHLDLSSEVKQAETIVLLRNLVNTPAEDMGPRELQSAVEKIAGHHGARCRTVVGDDLLKEDLHAIHAVGRAATSDREPRLIDMQWGEGAHPLVTIVGKGVCFDTGGLGLKPALPMRRMKKDMAGAAHALALAHMIMAHRLPVRLRLLIPAVENAVSSDSFRPGDVIRTRKGITVEIGHTDAEGRLILCEALALASEDGPRLLLDFATLTGANTAAVGPDFGGVYTNSDELWRSLETASRKQHDPLWRMPLWPRYDRKIKSDVADICNQAEGFPYAGGTTAALFLQRFIEPEIEWAHFDFFGWHLEAEPGRPKGAAAIGVRAAFNTIRNMFG